MKWFEIVVLGLPVGSIFKGQGVQEDSFTLEDWSDR
jgi:hypothetical protein